VTTEEQAKDPEPATEEAAEPDSPRKRPIEYTDALAERLLDRIANREELLKDIFSDPSSLSARTLRKWRANPEFNAAFEQAYRDRADSRMAYAEALGKKLLDKLVDPVATKTLIDLEMKLAANEHASKYGPKSVVSHQHGGVGGKPISIAVVDDEAQIIRTAQWIADAFIRSGATSMARINGNVIDATALPSPEVDEEKKGQADG